MLGLKWIVIISPAIVFLKSMNSEDRVFTLIQKNDEEFLLFSFKTLCVCVFGFVLLFIYNPDIFHFQLNLLFLFSFKKFE